MDDNEDTIKVEFIVCLKDKSWESFKRDVPNGYNRRQMKAWIMAGFRWPDHIHSKEIETITINTIYYSS